MVAETHPTTSQSSSFAVQDGYAYRFEWGANGLRALAPEVEVIVVVDVLRFTSAVSAAVEVGATVFPCRWNDDQAAEFARSRGARLAGRRELGELSLSPTDLLSSAAGTRLVLPSPNGAALTLTARELGAKHVLAGCLRNASVTASVARTLARRNGAIGIIGAGERWHDEAGVLRPAVEDLIGAGAILAALDPSASVSAPACSPEAAAARAAFVAARPRLHEVLAGCASGRELIARGAHDDVDACAALDVATRAAVLFDDSFVAA
jgi:2-phosphosulfolactate phosphatase